MNSIKGKCSKILMNPVCDNCLGRQFGHLMSGFTNKERGEAIRRFMAMEIDARGSDLEMSNFQGFKFHNSDINPAERKECILCRGFFNDIDKWTKKIQTLSRKLEYNTFHIGTLLPPGMIEAEEEFWEKVGIEYCEPLKAEINREVGKAAEKMIKKNYSKNPDVIFLIDIKENKVKTRLNPLMIYGEYQKLIRGIPQTKWPTGKYKTSVEQIIAKPFILKTKGSGHKFHGAGREDIDARCLGWRPFVLEILEPRKRIFKIPSSNGSKVKVRKMRFASSKEIHEVKEARYDKTYNAIVDCEDEIDKSLAKKINSIKKVMQRTPNRVSHRRSDKVRERKIISIKAKILNKKQLEVIIKGEAGLYIKELISGDDGRTEPNISDVLGIKCVCKYLDVIKIHK